MNIVKCTLCSNDSKLVVAKAELLYLIKKRLGVLLTEDADDPILICSECCLRITEFEKFRKKVRKLIKKSNSNESEYIKDESANRDEDVILAPNLLNAKDVQQNMKKKRNENNWANKDEDVTSVPHSIKVEDVQQNTKKERNENNWANKDEDVTSVPHSIKVEDEESTVKNETISLSSDDSTYMQDTLTTDSDSYPNQDHEAEVFAEELCILNGGERRRLSEEERLNHAKANQLLLRNIRTQCHLSKEERICSLCLTVWPSTKHLFEHRRKEHPELNGFHCRAPGCEEMFNDLAELRNHQKLEHHKTLGSVKCDTCTRRFESKLLFGLHQCPRKKYICSNKCGYRFKTEEELAAHFRKCRPGSSSIFTCSMCRKTLSCAKSLKLHHQVCLRAKNALKSTMVSNELAIQASSVEAIIKSAISCSTFTPTSTTTTASSTFTSSKHKTKGSFKCLKCDAIFDYVNALETHYSTCKGDYSNAIKCPLCRKSFVTEKALKLHQITESHGYPRTENSQDELKFENDDDSSHGSNEDVDFEKKIKMEPKISEELIIEPEISEKLKTEPENLGEMKIEREEPKREKIECELSSEVTADEGCERNGPTSLMTENESMTQSTENEFTEDDFTPNFEDRMMNAFEISSDQRGSSNYTRGYSKSTRTRKPWPYQKNYPYYGRFYKPQRHVWRNNTRSPWLPKNEFRF